MNRCGNCNEWTSEEDLRLDPMVEVEHPKWGNYLVHVEYCFDPTSETLVNDEDHGFVEHWREGGRT